jgi:RHS repeat-associated protein
VGKASGSPGQTISLPQGGGALHGIGEKFSADLQKGTGNFTVPIALPPGRNGFQPQLSLAYSTGNGNGPFGLGWGLSVPGVARKTTAGVPLYDDARDVFILSGSEDLVPAPGAPAGAQRYRPRTEGLFAHIDHYHDAQNDYWRVGSKDGLVSFYGTSATAGADPAVIADPADRRKAFAWQLTRTIDTFGNRIDYIYERDHVQIDGPHRWDQLYLSEIRYVDYVDQANPSSLKFLVTVRFVYEDRPEFDRHSSYRSGFEIRTVRRCVAIEVASHAEEDVLIRTVHLVYLDQRSLEPGQLPANGVSLLSQIRVEGHDGASSEWLPQLEFDYTRFHPDRRDFFPVTGPGMPPGSLARPDQELVDLTGDGLPDILQMNGTVRYWRNLGNGQFDLPREIRKAPAGLQLSDNGVQLLDANGDGRADLMVTTDIMAGYYPLRFDATWDGRSFRPYRFAPSFDLKDPEVRMVDLDGDGVTDAIRSGTRLDLFFNDPQLGWNGTRRVERRALEDFPNVSFSDPRVKWADITGDGLQDILLVHDGSVEYWPSLGRGDWGKRISMHYSPRFPSGYDPKRILIGDVDGDGLADLVYVDDKRVTLWLNQGGNRWSAPVIIEGTPPVTDMDAVRLTDLQGSGVSGVLWSSDANGSSRANMYFLDFTGGIKPYLLNQMDNHIGAVTRVEYAPSTRFFLEDQQRHETRWKTPLPFPVQVVARVEVSDHFSRGKLTTEYRYHHGYWDGAEREFRGFGRVDQRDTEVFDDYHSPGLFPDRPLQPVAAHAFSPPIETRTWFHLGPVGDEFSDWEELDFREEYWSGDAPVLTRPPDTVALLKSLLHRARRDAVRTLRGSALRSELFALDGTPRQDRPYTVTESLFGVREDFPPGPDEEGRQHIFFPHAVAQRTTQWERGNDPMTQFTFTADHGEFGYDEYGQARAQVSIAVPRGRNFQAPGEPCLVTHAITSYAQRNEDKIYIVDRVATASTYEIVDDGKINVFDLAAAVLTRAGQHPVIGQTYNYYDGDAFVGLDKGQIGDHGALVRTESLVLTEEILHEAYKSGGAVQNPPEEPPYLARDGAPPPWTADYPQEFRDKLPELAGYRFHPGGPEPADERGFFVETERRMYDVQSQDPLASKRGLLITNRDPIGRDTSTTFDDYNLLPKQVTNPACLTVKAVNDYRVFQPKQVTDPNGNMSIVTFTPLGMVATTWVKGKLTSEGDQQRPSVVMEYDFLAYEHQQPIHVRALRQVHHDTEADVALPARDETIESIEYSDGLGRMLQTRTQAEDEIFGDATFGGSVLPADQSLPVGDAVGSARATNAKANVVVSGWQVYDNKGRVVEKYEPFFSTGWDYAEPVDAQRGQKATMFYDSRGRIYRTLNPDGSEQRVVYGVPGTRDVPVLTDPDFFEPTPWETYTYDANDNAGRTHPAESADYKDHWNTPASILADALGRTIEATARNGQSKADEITTKSTFDIQGNLLTVTDALGRPAFQHVYDRANHPLRTESIDAGVRRMVLDALGNVIEGRDSKGALALHAYDILNRPIRLWARDGTGQKQTLRQRLTYGDSPDAGLSAAQISDGDLLGKPYQQYDEAGLVTLEAYDFKGNPLEKIRQVISDAQILSVFGPAANNNWNVQAYRADWQPSNETLAQLAASLLDSQQYRTSTTYDALNRGKVLTYPADVNQHRAQLHPTYNRAGALESVTLDVTPYVQRIAYNAKGQRTIVLYGNGLMTRYAYDPHTFRLARMRTEKFSGQVTGLVYHPTGPALQDFAYGYDLAGNITAIQDRAPGSGVPNFQGGVDALDRDFKYDPIYRLLTATGRENDLPPLLDPWDDMPHKPDPNRTRPYTESYKYDQVGNILELKHQASGGTFTRSMTLVPGNNRLATVTMSQSTFVYTYDENGKGNGNLTGETTSRHFEWDYADRMRVFRSQIEVSEASTHTHYLYDANGQRVKKFVRSQGGKVEVTVYVDSGFEHHLLVQAGTTLENDTLHVMDNQSRVALVRAGNPFPGDAIPTVAYHLGDHLGSSHLVIDDTGAWVKREEYLPYGETSFGSFARKRYRFTGKERDVESRLCYYGARYYAVWLGRWVSSDPAGAVDGTNLFAYARDNPTTYADPSGHQSGPSTPFSTGAGGGITPQDDYDKATEGRHDSFDAGVAELLQKYESWAKDLRKYGGWMPLVVFKKEVIDPTVQAGIPRPIKAAVALGDAVKGLSSIQGNSAPPPQKPPVSTSTTGSVGSTHQSRAPSGTLANLSTAPPPVSTPSGKSTTNLDAFTQRFYETDGQLLNQQATEIADSLRPVVGNKFRFAVGVSTTFVGDEQRTVVTTSNLETDNALRTNQVQLPPGMTLSSEPPKIDRKKKVEPNSHVEVAGAMQLIGPDENTWGTLGVITGTSAAACKENCQPIWKSGGGVPFVWHTNVPGHDLF